MDNPTTLKLASDLVNAGALVIISCFLLLSAAIVFVWVTRRPKEVATPNTLHAQLTTTIGSLAGVLSENLSSVGLMIKGMSDKLDNLSPRPMLEKLDILIASNNDGIKATVDGMNAISTSQSAIQSVLADVKMGLATLPGDWDTKLQQNLSQSIATIEKAATGVLERLGLAEVTIMGKLDASSKSASDKMTEEIAPLLASMKDVLRSLADASTRVNDIIKVADGMTAQQNKLLEMAGAIVQQQQNLLDAVQRLAEKAEQRATAAATSEPPTSEGKATDAHD